MSMTNQQVFNHAVSYWRGRFNSGTKFCKGWYNGSGDRCALGSLCNNSMIEVNKDVYTAGLYDYEFRVAVADIIGCQPRDLIYSSLNLYGSIQRTNDRMAADDQLTKDELEDTIKYMSESYDLEYNKEQVGNNKEQIGNKELVIA